MGDAISELEQQLADSIAKFSWYLEYYTFTPAEQNIQVRLKETTQYLRDLAEEKPPHAIMRLYVSRYKNERIKKLQDALAQCADLDRGLASLTQYPGTTAVLFYTSDLSLLEEGEGPMHILCFDPSDSRNSMINNTAHIIRLSPL